MFNGYVKNGHLIITNLTHFESFSNEVKKNNTMICEKKFKIAFCRAIKADHFFSTSIDDTT